MNIKSFLALSFSQKKIFLCDKEKYNYSIMKIISLLLNPINYKKSEFMKKIYFLPLCLFAAPLGRTTGAPAVRPTRSSRTKVSSPQISYARDR